MNSFPYVNPMEFGKIRIVFGSYRSIVEEMGSINFLTTHTSLYSMWPHPRKR